MRVTSGWKNGGPKAECPPSWGRHSFECFVKLVRASSRGASAGDPGSVLGNMTVSAAWHWRHGHSGWFHRRKPALGRRRIGLRPYKPAHVQLRPRWPERVLQIRYVRSHRGVSSACSLPACRSENLVDCRPDGLRSHSGHGYSRPWALTPSRSHLHGCNRGGVRTLFPWR